MAKLATLLTTVPLALLTSAGVAAAAGPAVTGSGVGTLSGAPFDGDTVQTEVTAAGAFNIVHHTNGGGVFAHLSGYVDCATSDGHTAVLTGVITAGFDGFGVDPVGERVSIEITDGSPDTVALDVTFVSGHPIAPCTSEPLFVLPVERGNYHVR